MIKKPLIFLLSCVIFNSVLQISGKLLYIEVKYPLLAKATTSKLTYDNSLRLWPMPQYVNNTSTGKLVLTKKTFKIMTDSENNCDIIDENIKHYMNVLFPPKIRLDSDWTRTDELYLGELYLEVTSRDCPKYPHSNMDESCK